MRGVSLVAIVLVAMLITPVQGTPIVDEVNMMQGGGNDDRQPTANNTTYWLFGSEAMDRGKGHFFYDGNNSEQGRISVPRRTLHKYLYTGIRGQLYPIPEDEWIDVAQLPTERFVDMRQIPVSRNRIYSKN